MRTVRIAGAAVLCAAIAGCGGSTSDRAAESTATERAPVTTSGSTIAVDPAPTAAGTSSLPSAPVDDSTALCSRTGVEPIGIVAGADLVEASGLVASRTHPGVLWSHNDGGDTPGVYAVGIDGADLGFHPLVVDGAVDVEDIAIGAGAEGDDIFLGDIGDNAQRRESISVYRFREPDPTAVSTITTFDVLQFAYPDGPHNAETLLVDEAAGRLVIVTKEQAAAADGSPDDRGRTEESLVFEGPLDGHGSGPVALVPAGSIDTPRLETLTRSAGTHPATLLGFGGVPTGGDASSSLVALRTYETVWVWPRGAGQRLVESFGAEPCQVTAGPELQGEAVAVIDDGLLTVAEGPNPTLYRLGR